MDYKQLANLIKLDYYDVILVNPEETESFIESEYLKETINTNNSVKSIVQNLKRNYWLEARYCNEEWIEWYYIKPVDYTIIIKKLEELYIAEFENNLSIQRCLSKEIREKNLNLTKKANTSDTEFYTMTLITVFYSMTLITVLLLIYKLLSL